MMRCSLTRVLGAGVVLLALALAACGPDLALLDSPTTLYIYDIVLTGNDSGWAVGEQPGKNRGVLLHEVGGRWVRDTSPPTLPGDILKSIAVIGNSLWIAGVATDAGHADTTRTSGFILSRTGSSAWQRTSFGNALTALAFTSPTNGWAIGLANSIYHFDGQSWTQMADNLSYNADLSSISMRSASDGWIVGSLGTFLHYDGSQWRAYPHISSMMLYAVAVSATDGWASGQNGTALHLMNGQWTEVATPMFVTNYAIAYDRAGDVWMAGDDGSVFELSQADGLWHHISPPEPNQLNTIAVSGSGTVWVGGNFSQDLIYSLVQGSWRADSFDVTTVAAS
jgi:photosystem II stability/assembly factor-like uncharacterized protein